MNGNAFDLTGVVASTGVPVQYPLPDSELIRVVGLEGFEGPGVTRRFHAFTHAACMVTSLGERPVERGEWIERSFSWETLGCCIRRCWHGVEAPRSSRLLGCHIETGSPPHLLSDDQRIDIDGFPPGAFITSAMQGAMVATT
jgi:hypothetical protein